MPHDPTCWPWDPDSVVLDSSAIDWPFVPPASMEPTSCTSKILKQLSRADLKRLSIDPGLQFLRDSLGPIGLKQIDNLLAGKNILNGLRALEGEPPEAFTKAPVAPLRFIPTLKPKPTPTQLPQDPTSPLNEQETASDSTQTVTQAIKPPGTVPRGTSKRLKFGSPEEILEAISDVIEDATGSDDHSVRLAALKLLGENLSLFRKDKPIDPIVTINVNTGVHREGNSNAQDQIP